MWGYFARTFTLTNSNSNKYQVTARDTVWDGNYPGTFTINRGEVLVSDIYLCDGSWQVSPKLPVPKLRFDEIEGTVSGHYTLKQDTDPRDVHDFQTNEVWHGTIDSRPTKLLLTKDCVLRLNAERNR
jgi:hypothetical protein